MNLYSMLIPTGCGIDVYCHCQHSLSPQKLSIQSSYWNETISDIASQTNTVNSDEREMRRTCTWGYVDEAAGVRSSDIFITSTTPVWLTDSLIRLSFNHRRLGRKQLIGAASAATSRDNGVTQRSGARRICSWFALSTGNRICRRCRRFRRGVALPFSSGLPDRHPYSGTEEQ